MKGKEDAPLNRRLMAGLIACLLLIVALAVAAAWHFPACCGTGSSWRSCRTPTRKRRRSCSSGGGSGAEAEGNGAAAGRCGGDAARAQELQKELEQAKKDLEAARKDLAAAKQQLASKVTGAVYPAGTKLIALTFDDGPGGKTTPRRWTS